MRDIRIDIEPPKRAPNLGSKLVEGRRSRASWRLCCIFEAPHKLRKNKENLFQPSLVSIGPYHHNSPQLQRMEGIKMWYLSLLLERSPTPGNDLLELLVKSVCDIGDFCRSCYAEKQKLPKDDRKLAEMLVVDGCFIIEYLRKLDNVVPRKKGDPIFETSWMKTTLVVDFLLLENQIPWVVLDLLYKKTQDTVEGEGKKLSLAQLFHNSTYSYAYRESPISNLDTSSRGRFRHLLHLHRFIILYSSQNKQALAEGNQEKEKPKFMSLFSKGPFVCKKRSDSEKHPGKKKRFFYTPCIKVLSQAGVSFQKQEGDDMMDIRFENGVLKIPQLRLMDYDEILLGNLVAYEQCDRDLEDKITSYACFLDNLISSSSDIETLRDAGIVSSDLGPEGLSGFFIGLYNNVHVSHYTYRDVAEDIRAYCTYTIPKWRVMFWRDYFSNPWSGISVIAAIIILVLTFVQTWCAVANS